MAISKCSLSVNDEKGFLQLAFGIDANRKQINMKQRPEELSAAILRTIAAARHNYPGLQTPLSQTEYYGVIRRSFQVFDTSYDA
jgi:hypothetical protein